MAYASQTKQTLYLAPASHFGVRDGERVEVTAKQQRRLMRTVKEKQADSLSSLVPYVLNMPVIVTHNVTVDLGMANGTLGTVSKIVLADADADIKPKKVRLKGWEVDVVQLTEPPKAVIIKPEQVKHTRLHGLQNGDFPVEPKTVKLKGFGKSGGSWFRVQQPIWPAFAITIHKSQGKTLKRVIADLGGSASCMKKGFPQLVYVALTRERSVHDIAILRGCRYERLRKPDPDLLAELDRLKKLEMETFGDFSTFV